MSVLLLTYNHEPFLAEAIEGVLAQKTDFPFELVIADDCSTDGTREVIRRYWQRYPDRIRSSFEVLLQNQAIQPEPMLQSFLGVGRLYLALFPL